MIFDEYAINEWAGETQAADEFFKDKNVRMKVLTWNSIPNAYLEKE